jgi:hypothetical protein
MMGIINYAWQRNSLDISEKDGHYQLFLQGQREIFWKIGLRGMLKEISIGRTSP